MTMPYLNSETTAAVKRKALHPMIFWAKFLLIVISVLLVVANLYTLKTTRDLARSYSNQQNQATWFLFQLTKEFTEMIAESPYILASEEKAEKVWLKYDLTWSRFDVTLNSEESQAFLTLDGTYPFFRQAFEDFKQLEPLLKAVKDNNSLKEFESQSQHLYQTIISYINDKFRVQSPIYIEQKQQALTLTQLQFGLMLVLFICIALVSFILHTEARFHKLLARTDPLTGLANRQALFETLHRYRDGQRFALMLLDLNGFKPINDQLGHQAGDTVLKQLAHRLNQIPTFHYQVFRMGGDEFAIVLDSGDSEHIEGMHALIMDCFSARFSPQTFSTHPHQSSLQLCSQSEFSMSCSLGTSCFPEDTTNINELIYLADKRMYAAKHHYQQSHSQSRSEVSTNHHAAQRQPQVQRQA